MRQSAALEGSLNLMDYKEFERSMQLIIAYVIVASALAIWKLIDLGVALFIYIGEHWK